MKRILIIGSSKLPVPAVKGGAVPNLIEEIIMQNEYERKLDLTCISLYDEKAEQLSHKYKRTKFIFGNPPRVIVMIDRFICWVFKNILKRERLISINYVFRIYWFAFFVACNLKKEQYDEVFFENSIPMLTALRLFGNRRKYRGHWHLHMHSVPRSYYGNGALVNECSSLICVSNYVKNAIMANKMLRLNQSQMKIMYNCVDTDLFYPMKKDEIIEFQKNFGLDIDKKYVLFVGRLCKEKGIEETIAALSKIKDVSVSLLIVGSNFYKEEIISPYEKKLVELSSSIRDRVRFTGYIDYQYMPHLYNLAEVVVLPSMWDEPAGMTMLEALACGRPLITTCSGGITEYVGDNNCILLNRDEYIVDAIAAAIESVLQNRKLAQTYEENGFLHAQRYSAKYYYKQFLEILGENE